MIYKRARQQALRIAKTSGSEAKLQIGLEAILKELIAKHGIIYNPAVNESLSKLGLSQVSSDRPDSLLFQRVSIKLWTFSPRLTVDI